jgi:hypothetical protein
VTASTNLATELQKIYDSEINLEMSWIWDGGIELRLGDRMNGYLAETTVRSVDDVVRWLQEAIAHFYPDSTYANGLHEDVKERASHQIFLPPMTGARVTCPYCGAPNPNYGRMEEIICFVCSRCGSAVEVARPKVQ